MISLVAKFPNPITHVAGSKNHFAVAYGDGFGINDLSYSYQAGKLFFNSTGDVVAAVHANVVNMIDVVSGACHSSVCFPEKVTSLSFHPESTRYCVLNGGFLSIHDKGKRLTTWRVQPATATDCIFLRDTIVVTHADGLILYHSGHVLAAIDVENVQHTVARGDRIAVCNDSGIYVYSAAGDRLFTHGIPTSLLAINDDYLLSVEEDLPGFQRLVVRYINTFGILHHHRVQGGVSHVAFRGNDVLFSRDDSLDLWQPWLDKNVAHNQCGRGVVQHFAGHRFEKKDVIVSSTEDFLPEKTQADDSVFSFDGEFENANRGLMEFMSWGPEKAPADFEREMNKCVLKNGKWTYRE